MALPRVLFVLAAVSLTGLVNGMPELYDMRDGTERAYDMARNTAALAAAPLASAVTWLSRSSSSASTAAASAAPAAASSATAAASAAPAAAAAAAAPSAASAATLAGGAAAAGGALASLGAGLAAVAPVALAAAGAYANHRNNNRLCEDVANAAGNAAGQNARAAVQERIPQVADAARQGAQAGVESAMRAAQRSWAGHQVRLHMALVALLANDRLDMSTLFPLFRNFVVILARHTAKPTHPWTAALWRKYRAAKLPNQQSNFVRNYLIYIDTFNAAHKDQMIEMYKPTLGSKSEWASKNTLEKLNVVAGWNAQPASPLPPAPTQNTETRATIVRLANKVTKLTEEKKELKRKLDVYERSA